MFHPQGPTFFELAQQAFSSTDRGYDLLAPKFEFTPFRTPDLILDAVRPFLLAPEGTSPAVGLDLCCGTGAAATMLRQVCTSAVLGIDRSAGMLAQARLLAATASGVPVRFEQGDATSLALDRVADVAVCFGAFGHLLAEEQPAFLAGVHQALVPGGRFVFITADSPPLWSPGLWLARAFNAGIHVRNAVRSPPFHMYYLNFLLPRAIALCEQAGFTVVVHRGAVRVRDAMPDGSRPWMDPALDVVIATR